MMTFEIGNYRFEELNCANELMFFTKGMSLIIVKFDKDCQPYFEYKDGLVHFVGLPKDVENELKRKIHELYPEGFVNREISTLSTEKWLTEKVHLPNVKKIKPIKGRMKIDGETAPQYKAVVDMDGKKEKIMIFAQQSKNRIIIFQKYIESDDLAEFPINIGLIECKGKKLGIKTNKNMFHFSEFVLAKEYKFNEKMEIISSSIAMRNDSYGGCYVGDMGSFLPICDKYLV